MFVFVFWNVNVWNIVERLEVRTYSCRRMMGLYLRLEIGTLIYVCRASRHINYFSRTDGNLQDTVCQDKDKLAENVIVHDSSIDYRQIPFELLLMLADCYTHSP